MALGTADGPVEFAIALHACLLAGAPAVPIDLRLSEAERAAAAGGARRSGHAAAAIRRRARRAERARRRRRRSRPSCTPRGTTGAPKPVELTYGNCLASALGSAVALGLDPDERWLCPMPLTHVGGLSIPIRSAIYATTAVLHERFDTEAVLAELMDPERRITLVSLVPTMLAAAARRRPARAADAALGAARRRPDRAGAARAGRARPGVPVAPTYGMTEACSQIATFGWPLPGVELAHRRDGEILVRGADRRRRARWPTTAGCTPATSGRSTSAGGCAITGRKADTIVTGGENVAPAEVEAVLLEHPAVADAGVFAPRRTRSGGRRWSPPSCCATAPAVDAARSCGRTAPRAWPRSRCPRRSSSRAALPRTGSGKLLRRELGRSTV